MEASRKMHTQQNSSPVNFLKAVFIKFSRGPGKMVQSHLWSSPLGRQRLKEPWGSRASQARQFWVSERPWLKNTVRSDRTRSIIHWPTYVRTFMCTHTHVHVHTCTHAHIYACAHTGMCTHAHMHTVGGGQLSNCSAPRLSSLVENQLEVN